MQAPVCSPTQRSTTRSAVSRPRCDVMEAQMSDPLASYLHDHLAGSNFAIDLLESMRDHYPNEPLGQLASTLLLEVEEDQETLKRVVDRVGKGSPDLKEAAAWIIEKASRFKLGHGEAKGIGTFEALENISARTFGEARALACARTARGKR
jgi:hypothetical protein